MAKYIHEIMSSELFCVEPAAARQDTLEYLLLLGVNGCPVIDTEGNVVGLVTLRDLLIEEGDQRVQRRISQPAITVRRDETIEAAGRKLAEQHAHQLVVQDDAGRAVGNVSAVDLVAALVGAPVTHPSTLLRDAGEAEPIWSNPAPLEPENTDTVPNAPGALELIYPKKGRVDISIWVEEARNLRARIDDLLAAPQTDQPALAYILERNHGRLLFRTAVVRDDARRAALVKDRAVRLKRRSPLGL